jgi:hypothetical protein
VPANAVAGTYTGTLSQFGDPDTTITFTVTSGALSLSVPAGPGAVQGFLFQGPQSPRNTALDVIVTTPTPQPLTLWVFWGDSNRPQVMPLGVGAGTLFFQATHRYSIQSFRQHRHRPYIVTVFVLAGSAPAQTLVAGSILVFQPAGSEQHLQRGAAGTILMVPYFPLEVASYVNG